MKAQIVVLAAVMVVSSATGAQAGDPKFCRYVTVKKNCEADTSCAWNGEGCCQTRDKQGKCVTYFNDGGCRAKDFCGFKCETRCLSHVTDGCRWNGLACLKIFNPPPLSGEDSPYDYTDTSSYDEYGGESGIVDQTNGILMYKAKGNTKGDATPRGFDNMCETARSSKCALGYPQFSMVCSSERDLTMMPKYMSMPKESKIYGENGKEITTLQGLISKKGDVKNNLSQSGLATASGNFWTGCAANGKFDNKLSCKNWSDKSKNQNANAGDVTGGKTKKIKAGKKISCNTNLEVMCLCPRKLGA